MIAEAPKEEPKLVVEVKYDQGKMIVKFGKVSLPIISHGLRIASLEIDNWICANTLPSKEESIIKIPEKVLSKIR
ncbi:MAG TPA: hypothetical protein V6D12_14125 [Candidatus Obscuribacterales bacterium]